MGNRKKIIFSVIAGGVLVFGFPIFSLISSKVCEAGTQSGISKCEGDYMGYGLVLSSIGIATLTFCFIYLVVKTFRKN